MTTNPLHNAVLSTRQRTLLACGLVLAGMAMVWMVSHFTARHQLEQQTESLGATLASQTALLATELVLANDLISLNVLLTELTRSPAISQAAVFTVDDQVLAIAGPSAADNPDREPVRADSHVAPIALQDSVAGYVRIHLDREQMTGPAPERAWMIPGAMVLMLALSAAVMIAVQHPSPPASGAGSRNGKQDDPGRQSLPTNAALHFRADSDPHAGTAARQALQQSLERVADLYQARLVSDPAAGGRRQIMQLQFSQSGQASELAYQALCCAVLVLAMNNRANRYRPEEARITLQAALHCAVNESDSMELNSLEETLRLAALISEQSPGNGLLASEQVLVLAGADSHFVSEWHSQLVDLLDGEPYELYLVRAPAGPTRALLQRQATLLRDEAADD